MMSSKEFNSLQKLHEDLLKRQADLIDKDTQQFSEDVKAYIAQAKKGGASISLIEEREQLRANLRYWASYIYGVDGQLPDTELAPSNSRIRFFAFSLGMIIFVILVFMAIGFSLGGFTNLGLLTLSSAQRGTAIAMAQQTELAQQIAIAKTKQFLAKPDAERIKSWLNAPPIDNNRFAALEKDLVGRYEVTSVGFTPSYYLEINMNCQCVTEGSNCCSPERMFVITLQRMYAYRDQILASVPSDTQYMDLICAEENEPFAVMYVPWDKVQDFLLDPSLDASVLSDAIQWDIP